MKSRSVLKQMFIALPGCIYMNTSVHVKLYLPKYYFFIADRYFNLTYGIIILIYFACTRYDMSCYAIMCIIVFKIINKNVLDI